ncbi:hypothetical protein AAFC00_004993 [Neodothiora populina]|uniref:Arabinan endo-1,5-alpha-L-arabinosidase n=1 Tax=Neodothiora populina TaxID=2781224 RepID=A0ABR3P3W9_9PEZI
MLFSLLAVPLALASMVAGYANPMACSGVCTNTHDPALIRRTSDGEYFRFATGGGIAIHKASSLTGPWVYQGEALSGGSKIDNSGAKDMWAPDVSYVGGTYYMYYAVSAFGTQNSVIGVATSKTMEVGSWTDHGSAGISSTTGKPYNAIDPNLYVGSDGKYYMQFGSFWTDIFQTTMKSSLTGTSGSGATNIAFNGSGTHSLEGSYMVYRDNYYYLFFSSGQCCNYDTSRPAKGDEYKIMVCRSTSPTSGFVDKNKVSCLNGGGTEVLASHDHVYGPGGQGVYNDPKNGWVLYYHYVDTTVSYLDGDKKLGINKISWSGGWPSV